MKTTTKPQACLLSGSEIDTIAEMMTAAIEGSKMALAMHRAMCTMPNCDTEKSIESTAVDCKAVLRKLGIVTDSPVVQSQTVPTLAVIDEKKDVFQLLP